MKSFVFKTLDVIKQVVTSKAFLLCLAFMLFFVDDTFAQAAGAFQQVTQEIGSYIPLVKKVIYAIAGVVAVVGTISVFFKMNNDDNDVKKSIMMIVGACIFLVAAAEALPMFFGY